MHERVSVGKNLKERDSFLDLGVDGKELHCFFMVYNTITWIVLIWPGIETRSGTL